MSHVSSPSIWRRKRQAFLIQIFWILQGGHKLPRNEIVQLNIFHSSSPR